MQRLGGSSCDLAENKQPKLALGGSEKHDKKGTEPVTIQGFEGWAPQRFQQPPQDK